MFGLHTQFTRRRLLPIFSHQDEDAYESKKTLLLELVNEVIPHSEDKLVWFHSSSYMFDVCSWALEANNPSVSWKVSKTLPGNIALRGRFQRFEISALNFVLTSTEVTHTSDIKSGIFWDGGLDILLQAANQGKHKVS